MRCSIQKVRKCQRLYWEWWILFKCTTQLESCMFYHLPYPLLSPLHVRSVRPAMRDFASSSLITNCICASGSHTHTLGQSHCLTILIRICLSSALASFPFPLLPACKRGDNQFSIDLPRQILGQTRPKIPTKYEKKKLKIGLLNFHRKIQWSFSNFTHTHTKYRVLHYDDFEKWYISAQWIGALKL